MGPDTRGRWPDGTRSRACKGAGTSQGGRRTREPQKLGDQAGSSQRLRRGALPQPDLAPLASETMRGHATTAEATSLQEPQETSRAPGTLCLKKGVGSAPTRPLHAGPGMCRLVGGEVNSLLGKARQSQHSARVPSPGGWKEHFLPTPAGQSPPALCQFQFPHFPHQAWGSPLLATAAGWSRDHCPTRPPSRGVTAVQVCGKTTH